MSSTISAGIVHEIPDDLLVALKSKQKAIEQWEDLTPLARNEWICWSITCKKPETRKNHIDRTVKELIEGKRRPCCWPGCPHRSDRKPFVRIKK